MENMHPLVSVVCLTYRKYEYIYNNIDSVLCQDYKNIEYIISDDGCDAFPKDQIVKYLDKKNTDIKYKVVSHDINVGTVKHINEIYKMAQGDIIVPLSADDVFSDSDIITKIVKSFIEKKCAILVTARWFCDEKMKMKQLQPSLLEQRYIINKLNTPIQQLKATIFEEFFDVLAGSTLYMTKSYFNQMGGFDESYRLLEDWPFFTDYTSKNCIDFDFSIVSINYRSGGVSHSGKGNSVIIPDVKLYNSTTRVKYKYMLDDFSQHKLAYIINRTTVKNRGELLVLWCMHPLIMYTKIRYKIFRSFAKIYDRFFVNNRLPMK